eukprot:330322_1
MSACIIVLGTDHIVYYQENKAFSSILSDIKIEYYHSLTSTWNENASKLLCLIQNSNNDTSFYTINLPTHTLNQKWNLCCLRQKDLTISIICHNYSANDIKLQIKPVLDQIYSQFINNFIEIKNIPLYIMHIRCKSIVEPILKQNSLYQNRNQCCSCLYNNKTIHQNQQIQSYIELETINTLNNINDNMLKSNPSTKHYTPAVIHIQNDNNTKCILITKKILQLSRNISEIQSKVESTNSSQDFKLQLLNEINNISETINEITSELDAATKDFFFKESNNNNHHELQHQLKQQKQRLDSIHLYIYKQLQCKTYDNKSYEQLTTKLKSILNSGQFIDILNEVSIEVDMEFLIELETEYIDIATGIAKQMKKLEQASHADKVLQLIHEIKQDLQQCNTTLREMRYEIKCIKVEVVLFGCNNLLEQYKEHYQLMKEEYEKLYALKQIPNCFSIDDIFQSSTNAEILRDAHRELTMTDRNAIDISTELYDQKLMIQKIGAKLKWDKPVKCRWGDHVGRDESDEDINIVAKKQPMSDYSRTEFKTTTTSHKEKGVQSLFGGIGQKPKQMRKKRKIKKKQSSLVFEHRTKIEDLICALYVKQVDDEEKIDIVTPIGRRKGKVGGLWHEDVSDVSDLSGEDDETFQVFKEESVNKWRDADIQSEIKDINMEFRRLSQSSLSVDEINRATNETIKEFRKQSIEQDDIVTEIKIKEEITDDESDFSSLDEHEKQEIERIKKGSTLYRSNTRTKWNEDD